MADVAHRIRPNASVCVAEVSVSTSLIPKRYFSRTIDTLTTHLESHKSHLSHADKHQFRPVRKMQFTTERTRSVRRARAGVDARSEKQADYTTV